MKKIGITREDVLEAEDKLFAAQLVSKVDILDQLLHDDLMAVAPTGQILTKTYFLFALLIIPFFGNGRLRDIDSLKIALNGRPEDISKVKLLNDLSGKFRNNGDFWDTKGISKSQYTLTPDKG